MNESRPSVDPLGVYSVKRACAELSACYKTLRKYRMNGYIQPMRQPDCRIAALCQEPDGLYQVYRAAGKDSRQDPAVAERRGAGAQRIQEEQSLPGHGPEAGRNGCAPASGTFCPQ